jgi:hypothetical protein
VYIVELHMNKNCTRKANVPTIKACQALNITKTFFFSKRINTKAPSQQKKYATADSTIGDTPRELVESNSENRRVSSLASLPIYESELIDVNFGLTKIGVATWPDQ